MARFILESRRSRDESRKLRRGEVIKHAKEMELDNFRVSNDAITFDTIGFLTNGQHRLEACVASGKDLKALTLFGTETDDVRYYDLGKKRNQEDRKLITGIAICPSAMYTLRFLCAEKSLQSQLSPSQEDAIYHRYCYEANWVCVTLTKKPFNKTAVYAALFRAYFNIEKTLLARFISVLQDGVPDADLGLGKNDPGLRLREWLWNNQNVKRQEQVKRREIYRKTLYAVRAFGEGKEVKILRAVDKDDFFPIKEEKRYFPAKKSLEDLGHTLTVPQRSKKRNKQSKAKK